MTQRHVETVGSKGGLKTKKKLIHYFSNVFY
jgi:hypothetical protein